MRSRFILLLVIVSISSYAQINRDTADRIDKVFSRYLAQNPGCQLSISRNNAIIFSKAWGMSDLEHNITLTGNSIIEAGSVSKQFTAAAILLLEEQGKLSLNDDVRKYIPEIPGYGTVIRLRHMIHHTSGLKDWGTVSALTGWGRGTKAFRNDDVVEIVARQKTLNNTPGAEFIYSNSNYNLLATVVQRVSGMSLADYTRQYIFIPAGMTHTQWRDNFKRIVPNRAIAYEKNDTAYESDMPNEYAYGNGGLLTTTEDLLKWNAFYLSGKLGSGNMLQKQIAVDSFNNGHTNYYGAGLFIQTTNGLKVIRHSGATGSYRCNLEYFPQLQLSIAWLSNTSAFDMAAYNVIGEVEKIFIKTPPKGASKKTDTISIAPEKLKIYEGWYKSSRNGFGLRLQLKDNNVLFANYTPLIPIHNAQFKMGDDLLVFGEPGKMMLINADKDTTDYLPVAPANISAATLKAYEGKYFSDETISGIAITVKSDTLLLQINSYSVFALTPIYKDAFTIADFGGLVNFDRDKNDRITALRIGQGRARNVLFIKTE